MRVRLHCYNSQILIEFASQYVNLRSVNSVKPATRLEREGQGALPGSMRDSRSTSVVTTLAICCLLHQHVHRQQQHGIDCAITQHCIEDWAHADMGRLRLCHVEVLAVCNIINCGFAFCDCLSNQCMVL